MKFPLYTKSGALTFVKHLSESECIRVRLWRGLPEISTEEYSGIPTNMLKEFRDGKQAECTETEYLAAFDEAVKKLRSL